MKKRMYWIAAAAACVICLSGCGQVSTADTEGQVSLMTKAQTTDAAASTETTAAETAAETAAVTEAAAETQAPEAQTEAAAPAETQAPEAAVDTPAVIATDAPAQPKSAAETPAADPAFAEKAKVTYNGVTFGVHDNFDAIAAQLGNETRPTNSAKPCIPGAGKYVCHHYPGFSVSVSEDTGVIYQIFLTESDDPGRDIATVGGLRLGMTKDDAATILGPSQSDLDFMYSIKDTQNPDFSIVANLDNGAIISIDISDFHVLIN